ncbi:hypothetical protein SteCoe_8266 [Stentor coeruleus]|uniref:Uncharacterized protein n=1 Tax=Stentor coeruleus TaxID=5963 RepID=A0A1R2CKK9_9CILI|nr:hypothetical protein SteCoe_8266 [Stentor coeruleus]
MEALLLEKIIKSEISEIKDLINNHDEDLITIEISKLIPKLMRHFYSYKEFEPLHTIFIICEWLTFEKNYDEYKVLIILEDILTCIDSCNLSVFLNYFEKISLKIVSKSENETKCKSIILRISNALLKRLSRNEHLHTRYQLHKILANCMGSISYRSGSNFRGQFSNKKSIFLSLSDDLFSQVNSVFLAIKDPYIAFCDQGHLDRFLTTTVKLIEKISNIKTYENSFNIYQPIEEIFDIQLKDSDFIIYLLGSIIFLAQTLQKPATTQQETSFVLNETQKSTLNLLSNKSKEILLKINIEIVKDIENLLESEIPWITWKMNKCPKFEREKVVEMPKEEKIELEDGELAGEEVVVNKKKAFFEEGERKPDINAFIDKVLVDLDPDEDIEDQYKSKNDVVFNWRFLRLISQSHIEEFKYLGKPDIEKISLRLRPSANFVIREKENDDIEYKTEDFYNDNSDKEYKGVENIDRENESNEKCKERKEEEVENEEDIEEEEIREEYRDKDYQDEPILPVKSYQESKGPVRKRYND